MAPASLKIFRDACVKLAVRLVESGTFRVHAAVGEAPITAAMATLLDRGEARQTTAGRRITAASLGR